MSYEVWTAISAACFIIAAVCLIIAVVMFISFDIKGIRKELSGKQVESYMQEYRQKKEERKRVGIYDPSGRLIDVKDSNIAAGKGLSGKMGRQPNPQQYGKSMGDALAGSRASASVRSESATTVLKQSADKRSDFVIVKNLVFTESSEFIG